MLNILGIDIDNSLDLNKTTGKLEDFLNSNKQNYVITPNPEIILSAQTDEEFFYILNQADLSLPDGFGLKLCAFLMNKKLTRVSGSDVLPELLSLAERKNKKVLIINREDGLSSKEDISIFLKNKHPNLNFFIENFDHKYLVQENRHNLLDFSADILICNFGAPHQEKFIFHNLKKLATVKLAIGIGGSFDFLTGKIKRAPIWMRKIGLEWLWRLIKQPKRYKRIFKAVIVFLIKFFYWRFLSHFFYRKNVACLLYRKKDNYYQILLVERVNEKGHWQIPQGGTDGQNIKIAGSRELLEELGTSNFNYKKIYKNIFKYKTNHRGRYGFKGQRQSLLLAEFYGLDSEIKINFWDHADYKWVKDSDFVNSVHPVRRTGAEIFFEKFKEYINK